MVKYLTIPTLCILASMTPLCAADEPAYPLSTCIVSGEKLDDMGKPYVFTCEGKQVELCCKSCKKDFDKDPAKYMEKLNAAAKAMK